MGLATGCVRTGTFVYCTFQRRCLLPAGLPEKIKDKQGKKGKHDQNEAIAPTVGHFPFGFAIWTEVVGGGNTGRTGAGAPEWIRRADWNIFFPAAHALVRFIRLYE